MVPELANIPVSNQGTKTYVTKLVPIVAGAETIDVVLDPGYRHSFIGVVYYDDAEGLILSTVTAGTSTTTIQTANQPHGFQAIPDGIMNSMDIDQLDWSANVQVVRTVLAGVVGAAYAKVIVTINLS